MGIHPDPIGSEPESKNNFSDAADVAEQAFPDEDVLSVSRRLMEKNHRAYEVLAQ